MKVRHCFRSGSKATGICALVFGMLAVALPVQAQDAETVASAMTIPVFESIDENRVDLTNGMLRLQSPLLSAGTSDHQMHAGLEWTGQSWRYIGVPTISRDGDTYIVTYNGATNEFNDRGDNYSQKKPVDGSSFECVIWEPGNFATSCVFTNRFGDIVIFDGLATPQQATFGDFAMQSLGMGNLGMSKAEVVSGRIPTNYFGNSIKTVFGEDKFFTGFDENYNDQTTYISLYDQQLTINTPNHDGTDDDEHYLRPKSTTQTITNDFGHVWSYTINGDREIAQYQMPGGLAPISYTYDGDHRVKTVTTAAGTWTYTFNTSGSSRIANVQTPTGRTYRVTSHKDEGYVTEYRESPGLPSERVTSYEYSSSGYRLIRVTYDEGNKDEFVYDARGNVTQRRVLPKSGTAALTWTANFDATCTERVLCNRPHYMIDPEGNRTDFEYAAHSTTQITVPIGGTVVDIRNVDFGHGQPIKIKYPAASTGAPRRIVTNGYYQGQLDEIRECMTSETCQGTSDEVVTEITYTTHPYGVELQPRSSAATTNSLATGLMAIPIYKRVTSGGQTLLTCYQYDENARLVGETPPAAELTPTGGSSPSCPNYFTNPPAYNATIPETGQVRAAPSFSQ